MKWSRRRQSEMKKNIRSSSSRSSNRRTCWMREEKLNLHLFFYLLPRCPCSYYHHCHPAAPASWCSCSSPSASSRVVSSSATSHLLQECSVTASQLSNKQQSQRNSYDDLAIHGWAASIHNSKRQRSASLVVFIFICLLLVGQSIVRTLPPVGLNHIPPANLQLRPISSRQPLLLSLLNAIMPTFGHTTHYVVGWCKL